MGNTADAVVIGGGIMGASIAHFLAKRRFGRIVLLEKRRLAAVSTGASAANVRTYYSNDVTVKLAWRAVQMFENDRDELGGDCRFEQIGFLLLIDERWNRAGDQILEIERRNGVEVRDLSASEIPEIAPHLNLEGISRGILEPRSGYSDPVRTTENLVRRAEDWGLEVRLGVGATGLRLDEKGAVQCVDTDQGPIQTRLAVNAAGPWGRQVGLWAGHNYSVRWSRESDLVLRLPEGFGPMPVISDPSLRFYFRPHFEGTLLAGLGFPKEIEPMDIDDYDEELDPPTRRRIENLLYRRLPSLQSSRFDHGYASIYTITDDWHPVVGAEPETPGYWVFFGGSGHGYKISPPLGESLAALICGETPPIDIHAYRPSRFVEGDPLTSAWGGGNRG